MKAKSLIVVFVLAGIVLLYSVFCYHVLNERIEAETKDIISSYFNTYNPDVASFHYLKAISDEDNTFQVFVRTNEEDYTFYFLIEEETYQLEDVFVGVPNYI